ncbi:MAG: TldD/PmbA family protein [Thermodesulfovibrionales bacterium]
MDIRFARNIVEEAVKAGVDEAEVFLKSSKGLTVDIKDGDIDSLETFQSSGYAIRLIKGKKCGFSFSNKTQDFLDTLKQTLQSLDYSEQDEYICLPESGQSANTNDTLIFDDKIDNLPIDDAIQNIRDIEAAAFENRLVKKIRKASGTFGSSNTIVLNSKGLECEYKATFVTASIMLVAEKDGESHTGWDYQTFRILKDIDFRNIGRNAAEKATLTLGAKRISSFKGLVLMHPPIVVEFLGILASSLTAESVQKNRSMLAGKIGQTVTSKNINITDTASLDGKVGSRPFDAEGTPTMQTVLIKEGILQGYLHNAYTAKKRWPKVNWQCH